MKIGPLRQKTIFGQIPTGNPLFFIQLALFANQGGLKIIIKLKHVIVLYA
jgi:hypothetical protein